jgi:protein-tyrosine phosphatase
VLIELPFQRLPPNWEHILLEVARRDFKILIAHPERCEPLSREPMLVERLLETGAYLQVNWTSLLGYHGRIACKSARRLLQAGTAHCMATDSHDTRERSALIVRRGARELARLVGQSNLARLTAENPDKVLDGGSMTGMDVESIAQSAERRVGFWRFLRRSA